MNRNREYTLKIGNLDLTVFRLHSPGVRFDMPVLSGFNRFRYLSVTFNYWYYGLLIERVAANHKKARPSR